jgi:hypothetical protein
VDLEGSMADAVLIGISAVFFALAFAFVVWMDRI